MVFATVAIISAFSVGCVYGARYKENTLPQLKTDAGKLFEAGVGMIKRGVDAVKGVPDRVKQCTSN